MSAFTHRGRITSIHGFLLPPKKTAKYSRYLTLRFCIPGVIPSKKNMIWATTNFNVLSIPAHVKTIREYWHWLKDNLKAYIRNSKKYQDWLENTRPLIIEQAAKEIKRYEKFGISYPLQKVSVRVYHYWAENQARDNSNKYDTIIDLFTTCGLIPDDCWQVVGKNESEAECYHGEIVSHITTIDVTVRIP